ncbi:MAG: hypothetical protein ACYDH3_10750 [Candidatus Aminicenantales bacterium]
MFPIWIRLKISKPGHRGFRLFFPVILIWIILAALMIALFPLMLLAALLTWRRGPGKLLIMIYPMLAAVLWNLTGLHVETKDDENDILIDFA